MSYNYLLVIKVMVSGVEWNGVTPQNVCPPLRLPKL